MPSIAISKTQYAKSQGYGFRNQVSLEVNSGTSIQWLCDIEQNLTPQKRFANTFNVEMVILLLLK